jgi:protein involved in polysaccharide export with SLBB domain/capsular polysaccharide biosynthesis protein
MNLKNGSLPPPAPFDAWSIIEIWRRRWLWVACWTLAMAVVGALIARAVWGHTYTSTAQLIHYEPSTVDDTYRPRALGTPSLVVILQAPGIFENVGSQLTPPVSARVLAERLQITLDRNNDVVTVAATGRTRDESVDIVNRFCAAAIAYTQNLQRQEATEAGDNLARQLVEVENELATTRRSVPIDRQAAVAALTAGANGSSNFVPSDLPQRIQAAQNQLDDLLARYTDAHPLVREQRARLAALVDEQRKDAASAAGANATGPRATSVPVALPFANGQATPEEIAMGERLRTLETNRGLLEERQRAIQPFRDNPPGYFRVLLSAEANPTQMRRHRLEIALFAFLGALLGFFGSASQMLVAELLSNRIRTRADVRRITGLPIVATLGDLKGMSPASRDQWAFRAWTALQGRMRSPTNQGMVCGITSAHSGDGRSTVVGLLSRAASSCGFRVLTITSRPSEKLHAEPAGRIAMAAAQQGASSTNDLSMPGQTVELLTREECPPAVSIFLPGWIWNLERRKQWRLALEAWRAVDHVVIFVELPPASEAETVLLAENIPNLLWLVDRDKSDAEETLLDLETLRHANCNLVGAVFNREYAPPMRGRFSRWTANSALLLLSGLCLSATRASATVDPAPAPDQPAAFSIADPAHRDAWQKHLTLGPGDVVSFHLYGSPELSRENVPIGPDGRVSYLEAENVLASGLTVDELRDRINDELGKFRRAPQANVIPVSYGSKRYYMMGTVVQRGVFALDRPTTVIEAVARARGFETGVSRGDTVEAADFSHSFLSRGGQRVPVDFERLFVHGDLSQNVALQPGDYLYFPAASSGQIFVLGEVGAPGPVAFDPDVNTLSAIASRGGFKDTAYKARVLVVRGSLDHPVTFTVDIAGALTGKSPNLALEPGDLVYVANRPWALGEDLLDLAATAFVESAVVTWTGLNVGPRLYAAPHTN